MVNLVQPGSIFNYSVSFLVNIDPRISNEEITEKGAEIIGRHVLILVLQYRGTSIFTRKTKTDKYFLGYEGRGAVYQLIAEEYEKIADKLPDEFKTSL
jgi:hypothetical protein